MSVRSWTAGLVVLAGCMFYPSAAFSDYFDDFSDGTFVEPDGVFDLDDPAWTEREVTSSQKLVGVDENRLRITALNTLFPFVFHGVSVEEEPNESLFNNTQAHYMLVNVRSHDENWDPNNGMAGVWMHGDFVGGWTAYDFEYQLNSGWISISTYSGFTWLGMVTKQRYHSGYPWSMVDPNSPYDPNDPNHTANPKAYIWPKDARIPFWMLLQFDPNGTNHNTSLPNNPSDPNCHWLRAACWTGDKYAWTGVWTLQANCVGSMLGKNVTDPIGGDFMFDPALHMDYYLHQSGYNSVAAFSGGESKQPETAYYCCDASYDDVEARNGYFSNSGRTLTVTINNPSRGTVAIHPNVLLDPNQDPNDSSFVRRYTDGTPVVLTATPVSGKAFDAWTIYDPNYPGDVNHAVTDTNTTLFLTMNGNYEVEAAFKCGSGLPPFIAGVLLVMGLGIVIRRVV